MCFQMSLSNKWLTKYQYIHTMEYYSAVKSNTLLIHAVPGWISGELQLMIKANLKPQTYNVTLLMDLQQTTSINLNFFFYLEITQYFLFLLSLSVILKGTPQKYHVPAVQRRAKILELDICQKAKINGIVFRIQMRLMLKAIQ